MSHLLESVGHNYYYDQCCDSSATLTKSEKGLPPEFEFVGVPSMIRKEKGKLHNMIYIVHGIIHVCVLFMSMYLALYGYSQLCDEHKLVGSY